MCADQTFIKDVPQDIYRKLQQHLDTLPIGYPPTESGTDLKILKFIFTPEEALIGINLRLIPESLRTIYRRVKKYGITLEQLEIILRNMYKNGAINVKRVENENGEEIYYHNAFLAVGMFEYQLHRMDAEFYETFEQYMDEVFRDEFASTKINQLRTIPVEKSITPEHHIATFDEIKNLIENANRIAVQDCVCRQGKDLIGKPCKVSDLREVCFVLDSSVQHILDNKKGREITKKEALDIFKKAQDAGLIIQPGNALKPNYICNCCGCCCDMITNIKKLDRPADLMHNNFYAEVNSELCVGCGTCEQRCQLEAISLEDGIAIVNKNLCIGCGNCTIICPEEAIILKKKTTEFIPPPSKTELYLEIMHKKAELRRREKGLE
jgi:electron transport complex protein RnfB